MNWRTSREFWKGFKKRMTLCLKFKKSRKRLYKLWIRKVTIIKRSTSWTRNWRSQRSIWESCNSNTERKKRTWRTSMSSLLCLKSGAGRWCSWSRRRRKKGRNWKRKASRWSMDSIISTPRKNWKNYNNNWRMLNLKNKWKNANSKAKSSNRNNK